jgi:choline kinase
MIDNFIAARESTAKVHTVYNEAFDTLGNGHSLLTARRAVGDNSFIKMDGDLLLDPNLIATLAQDDSRSLIAYDRKAQLDAEAMKARFAQSDGKTTVSALGKWLPVADAHAETIGVEHITAADAVRLFEIIHDLVHIRGQQQAYYEDAYHEMIEAGWQLAGVDIGAALWAEIDDHDDLARAAVICEETGGWD